MHWEPSMFPLKQYLLHFKIKPAVSRNSHCGAAEPVTTRLWVWSLASLSGSRIGIAVSCGVGCRRGSDPEVLWLWRRPAAVAPIGPLAWELLYAGDAALTIQTDMQTCGRELHREEMALLQQHAFPNSLKVSGAPHSKKYWVGFQLRDFPSQKSFTFLTEAIGGMVSFLFFWIWSLTSLYHLIGYC